MYDNRDDAIEAMRDIESYAESLTITLPAGEQLDLSETIGRLLAQQANIAGAVRMLLTE